MSFDEIQVRNYFQQNFKIMSFYQTLYNIAYLMSHELYILVRLVGQVFPFLPLDVLVYTVKSTAAMSVQWSPSSIYSLQHFFPTLDYRYSV